MADDEGTTQYAGEPRRGLARLGGDLLNDDDRRVLVAWRENLSLLDPRYGGKGVLALAALYMANKEIRSRLLTDLYGVLEEAPALAADLPEGVTLRLFENTSNTLNVVLPPPSGEMSRRPAPLRDVLRSRTDALLHSPEGGADDYDLFQDDFNLSDSGLRDAISVGDPGGHDFP